MQVIEQNTMPATVFATMPHFSRSEGYKHVNTGEVLEALAEHDFLPIQAFSRKVRDISRRGFEKHVIRLRRSHDIEAKGGTVSELVLLNSHDGTSAMQCWAGRFRFICSNGMIVCTETFGKVSIPHRGNNVLDRVIDASYRVIHEADESSRLEAHWNTTELTVPRQLEYASQAAEIRYGSLEKCPATPEQLNTANRHEDVGNNLWLTFNRVQENLVRGGIVGQIDGKRRSVRAIRGAERNVSFNADLWALTDTYS